MADYELQGEITTNTIDSEILSAPIIESEMMLGDTVVIDHYYNGLESDTVKITVDNDNNTIKADVNVGASVLDFAESEYNKSKNLFPFGNVSGTKQVQRFISLPAGTYTLSAIATSSDTDANTCVVGFYNKTTDWIGGGQLARGTRQSITVSLAQPTLSLIFFASNNQPNSEGDTFTYADIQIEEGSIATAYYPYSGEITHNGDPAVEFAESEYQKSKNLLTIVPFSKTINGITITANNDIITINGTTTAFTTINEKHNLINVNIGKYVLSLKHISGTISGNSGSLTLYNKVVKSELAYPASSVVDNITEETSSDKLYIAISNGITFDNFRYQLQYEAGSSATDYQSYHGAIVHQGDIAPVVLYDKNSTLPSINKGYTSGIMSDGIGNVRVSIDFSPYKKVKIYANLDRMNAVSEYDFTSGTDQFSILCGDIASSRANVNYMSGYITKTEFIPVFAGLGGTSKDNNTNYYVYRIEGIE